MPSAPISRNKFGQVTVFGNPASAGSNLVVLAPGAGIQIRVLSLVVMSVAANSVKFLSGSTDITCTFPLAASGGFVLDHNPAGHFQTNANEALNINLSGATAVGFQLNYQLTQV